MQLCYRGVPYNHEPIQFKTGPGERVIRFRGSSVVAHPIDLSQPALTQEGLQYRWVMSHSERKLQFLGKSYNHLITMLLPAAQ